MNGLDLFSGIGGLSLALKGWVKPIAYCEIDPYCQAVLLSRMGEGKISNAPIWDDIKSFNTNGFRNNVDIIYGGFPCQDISITGDGKGLEGERSKLFFEIIRISKEIQPKFIFLENVPAITTRGGLRVVKEVACLGYDTRWCTISAQESCDALHERKRWFLLAYSKSERFQETGQSLGSEKKFTFFNNSCEHGIRDKEPEDKLEVDGMANGLSHRMDRIKALGNAVVPSQARKAFEILMGVKWVK